MAKTYTAGNPSDPNVVAKRTPATYLTEVLRTLRAAVDYTEARDQMTAAAEKQMQEARAAQLERELRYIAEHPELGLEPYGNGNYIGPDGWSVYRFDDGSSEPYILGTEETIDFWA